MIVIWTPARMWEGIMDSLVICGASSHCAELCPPGPPGPPGLSGLSGSDDCEFETQIDLIMILGLLAPYSCFSGQLASQTPHDFTEKMSREAYTLLVCVMKW